MLLRPPNELLPWLDAEELILLTTISSSNLSSIGKSSELDDSVGLSSLLLVLFDLLRGNFGVVLDRPFVGGPLTIETG